MKKFTFALFEGKQSNTIGEYSVFAKSEEAAIKELLKYSLVTSSYRLAMVS